MKSTNYHDLMFNGNRAAAIAVSILAALTIIGGIILLFVYIARQQKVSQENAQLLTKKLGQSEQASSKKQTATLPEGDENIAARAPEVIARAPEVIAREPEVVARAPEVIARAPEVIGPMLPDVFVNPDIQSDNLKRQFIDYVKDFTLSDVLSGDGEGMMSWDRFSQEAKAQLQSHSNAFYLRLCDQFRHEDYALSVLVWQYALGAQDAQDAQDAQVSLDPESLIAMSNTDAFNEAVFARENSDQAQQQKGHLVKTLLPGVCKIFDDSYGVVVSSFNDEDVVITHQRFINLLKLEQYIHTIGEDVRFAFPTDDGARKQLLDQFARGEDAAYDIISSYVTIDPL